MKRAVSMMAPDAAQTISISSDVLANFATEFQMYPDAAKQLLLSLNLTPEQKAVLTKSSINHYTEEKKLLNDVYAALHLTEAQTQLLTDALGINELTASAVQALYKLKTLHSAGCFLIDLYRHGIVYFQGWPVARIQQGDFIAVKQESEANYPARQLARLHNKTFSGYNSYQALEKAYHQKNEKGYADKFAYLLCQHQDKEQCTEDDRIRNTANIDVKHVLDYNTFWNVHNPEVRKDLGEIRAKLKKVANNKHVRNSEFSDEQAEKYAKDFVEEYSRVFWIIAEHIYSTLKESPNKRAELLNLHAWRLQKMNIHTSAALMNDANTNSAKWIEVLGILAVVMTGKKYSASVNTNVVMYNSSVNTVNSNNNNTNANPSRSPN